MKEPAFLLQRGQVMTSEKIACSLSDIPILYCSFEEIKNLDPKLSITRFIPVGSVEFTERYANHVGIKLPSNISYFPPTIDFAKRNIRVGKFKDTSFGEFVKPFEKIKFFTGSIKEHLDCDIDPEEDVWISEPVTFESEFRFYIQSYANKWEVLGWSRYDPLDVVNPNPDHKLVGELAEQIYKDLGPNAYTIDIGWRPDLREYDIIELNDAWALGLYEGNDQQSKPPTKQQYADMLYSRWLQIVFCNLV